MTPDEKEMQATKIQLMSLALLLGIIGAAYLLWWTLKVLSLLQGFVIIR